MLQIFAPVVYADFSAVFIVTDFFPAGLFYVYSRSLLLICTSHLYICIMPCSCHRFSPQQVLHIPHIYICMHDVYCSSVRVFIV